MTTKKPATPTAKKPAPAKKPAAKPTPSKVVAKAPEVKQPAKKPTPPKAPVAKKPVAAKPTAPKAPVAKKPAAVKPVAPKPPVVKPTPPAAAVKKRPASSRTAKSPAASNEGAPTVESLSISLENLRGDVARLRRENADLLRQQTQVMFNILEQSATAQLQMLQQLRKAASARKTTIKSVPDEEPSTENTVTIQVTEQGYRLSIRVPGDVPSFAEVHNDEIDQQVIVDFLNKHKVKVGDVLHANVYLI